MAKRPELLILNGELAGKRYAVGAGGLRLGRSSSNDIHVPDEELSRNHCLFEAVGDSGIRLTDLASANGTVLNGKPMGSDPVDLRAGDVIEVGKTQIRLVGDEPPPAADGVDLGFGEKPAAAKGRSPVANALWFLVVIFALVAVAVLLTLDVKKPAVEPKAVVDENPPVKELYYEKVEASPDGIFRYELTLAADGVLRVAVDDVPKENRHIKKSQQLGEAALKELNDIVPLKVIKDIDREYAGAATDVPTLESWELRVVYANRARTVRIVNTQEPVAFRAVRERLEAFSKNELGVWAMQYSRDKLVALAEQAVQLGRTKYEDRDVTHGNLFAAITAYREAMFYLETVDPKPDCFKTAREGFDLAKAELDTRYNDQRFRANRAINLGQWELARRELAILLEMIPDRGDERNREASAKLVDVESRMKKKGGR